MKTVVAITGAGWDPVTETRTRERGFGIPERTPEMFWRFSLTHTVLSRLIAQFEQLGASLVFVGMGEPGCSATVTEDHDAKAYGVAVAGYGQSPWTDEQVGYITAQGAVPILMPDPHAKGKSCWTTLLRMAPVILAADWDHIVISAGDYIFRTEFLQHLLEKAKWPSQFWFWTKHSMEFLDRRGFVKFLDFLRSLPDLRQSRVWLRRRETGFPQTVWGKREDVFGRMAEDWMEVDPHCWEKTLVLVKEDPV